MSLIGNWLFPRKPGWLSLRQVHLTASLDYVAIHADCPLFGGIHRQGDWYKNLTFIWSCHLLNAKTGKKSRWSAYAANWDYARRAVLLLLSHTRRLSDRTPVNASVAHSGRSSICILFSRLNQPSCTQPCFIFFHVCKSGTIDYKAVWDLSEGRLSSNVCCVSCDLLYSYLFCDSRVKAMEVEECPMDTYTRDGGLGQAD